MRIRIAAIAGLAAVTMLSACNTVGGAGKDLQSAGTAVEKVSGQKGKK